MTAITMASNDPRTIAAIFAIRFHGSAVALACATNMEPGPPGQGSTVYQGSVTDADGAITDADGAIADADGAIDA